MAAITERMNDLRKRFKQAWELLDLDAYPERIKSLEKSMQAPDFWEDQKRAKAISQEAADLSSELEAWKKLRHEFDEAGSMLELAREEGSDQLEKEAGEMLDEFEILFRERERDTLFNRPYDKNNAIVSIHAGAGGTDAMDWAGLLLRMYARYVENKGWSMDITTESSGEEAGYKSVTFVVRGRRAYGHFKTEAGVHRLVRISPFDAEGLRHTSFALVEVVPELDEISEKQVEIDTNNLRVDTFMASGKGGQSVNTTDSAVRVTHVPTGIVVSCQNERSQRQNKETALRILKSRLLRRMREERAEKIEELKGGHKSPEWGNQIRSYVLHPYKMVKDHRTKKETSDVDAVLDGELDPFIDTYLRKQFSQSRDIEKPA